MNQQSPPEIATVAKRLTSAGTPILAVPESALADERVRLLYSLTRQSEDLVAYLDGLDNVMVGDEKCPLTCVNIHHSDVHFVRRLPIYAREQPTLGLSEMPLDKGIEQLHVWLSSGREPKPMTPETAPLHNPIQKLINGGAVAIGLEKEIFELVDSNSLSFRVHGPPAIGVPLVNQYEQVIFDGETYDVDWTFALDGPRTSGRAMVYAGDNIIGMDPIPLETGWENLREYLRKES